MALAAACGRPAVSPRTALELPAGDDRRCGTYPRPMADISGRQRNQCGAGDDAHHFDVVLATMFSGSSPGDTASMEQAIADYLKSITWAMALTVVGAPRWSLIPACARRDAGDTT